MRKPTLISLAAVLLLSLAGTRNVNAQFSMGLYKDGQLIDTLGLVPAPAAAATGTLAPGQKAAQTAAPVISPETQTRNQAFAASANAAIQIQEMLRELKAASGATLAPQSSPLAAQLEQYIALQESLRAAYATIGNEILAAGLPPEIFQRHLDNLVAVEAGFMQFTNAVSAVLAGQGGALESAVALMDQIKFQNEPDLTKAGPTRVPMQTEAAPELTREQADAQLGVTAKKGESGSAAGFSPSPQSSAPPAPDDLAETPDIQLTSEIRAQAAALGNSPYAIHNFVKNKCAFQPYLGSRKGAVNTLRQLAGNDTDQASLLLALLRAAGIPSRYVRGTVEMTPAQAKSWLAVENTSTAGSILATAGLNGVNVMSGTNVTAIRCTRVWVEAYVPYSNYRGVPNDATGKTWIPLDPAFKETIVMPGEDVLSAMGYNNDAFLANYISSYNSNSPIEQLELNIQNWLNTNRPGKKVADITRNIVTKTQDLGLLPASLPVELLSAGSPFSALAETNRFKVRFRLYDGGTTFIDFTTNLSQLAGHTVTINYLGATTNDQATIDSYGGIYQTPPYLVRVKPVLKVDGTPVAASVNSIGMGYTHSSDMYFLQPTGDQNQQPAVYNEITAGNGQAIAFDTFLDVPNPFLSGTNSATDSLLSGLLQSTAVDYLSRVDRGEERGGWLLRTVHTVDVSEVIAESSVAVTYGAWSGVPQTFAWTGMTVDADRRIVGPFGANGEIAKKLPFMFLTGYDGSFMESDVFEDMYNQKAVSTVRILQLASDRGIPICYITNSIASACPGFSHSSSVLSAVNDALAIGHVVIIPRSDITVSNWSGTGYIDLNPATGAAGYIISGGISGSVSANGGATVDVWPINLGCAAIPPITGTISPNGFSDGAILCGDDSTISYTVALQYNCKDAKGNITPKTFGPTSHTVPGTRKTIAQTYGSGVYTISIPGTQVAPVSFTLVYLKFSKPEEYTCWQQNGEFDVKKVVLTPDSAQDDNLVDWKVTGSPTATITPPGTVKFGTEGGKYTVKAAAKGNTGCSDTLTLYVLQLTNQTVATTPANTGRTKLGVGEHVLLTLVPTPPVTLNWSASSGSVNPASGSSTLFTAPSNAAAATVTVSYTGGSCVKSFSVVGPTGYTSPGINPITGYGVNNAGAGMTIRVLVTPTDVSFYRVTIMEIGRNAANITGYYTSHTPPSHIGHGADQPVPLGYANAIQDRAALGSSDCLPPWSVGGGGFTWPIPALWWIPGCVSNNLPWSDQSFSLVNDSGTVTVQKFGHTVTRGTNDVYSTVN